MNEIEKIIANLKGLEKQYKKEIKEQTEKFGYPARYLEIWLEKIQNAIITLEGGATGYEREEANV